MRIGASQPIDGRQPRPYPTIALAAECTKPRTSRTLDDRSGRTLGIGWRRTARSADPVVASRPAAKHACRRGPRCDAMKALPTFERRRRSRSRTMLPGWRFIRGAGGSTEARSAAMITHLQTEVHSDPAVDQACRCVRAGTLRPDRVAARFTVPRFPGCFARATVNL